MLVEEIQQTKFDMLMSIEITSGNDPVRQQRLANIKLVSCHRSSTGYNFDNTNVQSSYYCDTDDDSLLYYTSVQNLQKLNQMNQKLGKHV